MFEEVSPVTVSGFASSVALFTVGHLVLGLALKAALAHTAQVKGWDLYTYWHSIVHTTIVLPSLLLHGALTSNQPFVGWLEQPWAGPELASEQWVQTANIGFQIAITLLSIKQIIGDTQLVVHHVVTIGGCLALLHGAHGAGYGALFTCWTEFGSTMHNLMILYNSTLVRWVRVITDVATRGGGMVLLLRDAPIAAARGLPLPLQAWTYVGGGIWFSLNAFWWQHVLRSLLRGKPRTKAS